MVLCTFDLSVIGVAAGLSSPRIKDTFGLGQDLREQTTMPEAYIITAHFGKTVHTVSNYRRHLYMGHDEWRGSIQTYARSIQDY